MSVLTTHIFTLISAGEAGFNSEEGLGEMFPKDSPGSPPIFDGHEITACGYDAINLLVISGVVTQDKFKYVRVSKFPFYETIFEGVASEAFYRTTSRKSYWEFNTTCPLKEGEKYRVYVMT